MVRARGANIYTSGLLSVHDIFVQGQSLTLGLDPKSWRILDFILDVFEFAGLRIPGSAIWSICDFRVVFGRSR